MSVSCVGETCLDALSCIPLIGIPVIGGRCAAIQGFVDVIMDGKDLMSLPRSDQDYFCTHLKNPEQKEKLIKGYRKYLVLGLVTQGILFTITCIVVAIVLNLHSPSAFFPPYAGALAGLFGLGSIGVGIYYILEMNKFLKKEFGQKGH